MRFTRMLCAGVAILAMTSMAYAFPVDLHVKAEAIYDYGLETEYRVPFDGTCDVPTEFCLVTGTVPDAVWFGVAVATDGTLGLGTGTVVYDVVPCPETLNVNSGGYVMDQMHDAATGWSDNPPAAGGAVLGYVASPYHFGVTSLRAAYNGGWGHDAAGLYHEGTPSGLSVLGPGLKSPLKWVADVNPEFLGDQNQWKKDVGLGTYMLEGPYGAGIQGGFGQDLSNKDGIVPGDGQWFFQESIIDLSGWTFEYSDVVGWQVVLLQAAVLNATLDYNVDIDGGFLINVGGIGDGLVQDSFAFHVIPEPATMGLILIGGLSLIRRRR